MRSADLLLHPVRLRIMQAFLGERMLTTSQLAAELDDVPPTSLYRHVAKLVGSGVLEVISQRRVRGAVERTYTLRAQAANISPDEIAEMTPEDHWRGFVAFVTGMLGDFDSYISRQKDVSFERDHVGYRIIPMWLSDEELRELAGEIGSALAKRARIPPGPGRKPRVLRTVWLPGTSVSEDTIPQAAVHVPPDASEPTPLYPPRPASLDKALEESGTGSNGHITLGSGDQQ
jgi:DNA-binding transcriptional ArsR family regulator